jgi:hypothetical protein
MKVLFVPLPGGPLGHLIPLLSLNKKLADSAVETAFLVPRRLHKYLDALGVGVVDIDYRIPYRPKGAFSGTYDPRPFRLEVEAYGRFCPDVVLDDTNPTTYYATALTGMTRITIQRTGIFPGGQPRNKCHQHSLGLPEVDSWPDVSFLGVQQPQAIADLFSAPVKIVPGVKSIEVLPEHLRQDSSYHFSGPLLMDDISMGKGMPIAGGEIIDIYPLFEQLQEFFQMNEGRRTVFSTFGTAAAASADVIAANRYLLDSNLALVTTIDLGKIPAAQQQRHYYAPWLPMDYVCSKVDFMLHHCGSGTYHFPILRQLPSITIGTGCYDRDDVAARLAELGISTHIPAPAECDDFPRLFKQVVASFLDGNGNVLESKRNKLAGLNAELAQTASAFDLEELIKQAVQSSEGKR